MESPAIPSTSSSREHEVDKTVEEQELTQKYLRGEISFAEYSNEWYGKEFESTDDVDDTTENEQLEQLDVSSLTQIKGKVPPLKRRKANRLSPALLGLMGEANIRFVRGEKEIAERMCYEIIRQVPNAAEPYQTLAQIHENDTEKSLQFSLLAAHLSPPDATEWLRLAAISNKRNDAKQEMICYSQAIKAEPQNVSLHLKRMELLTSLEQTNYPVGLLKITKVRFYEKLVTSLPPSEGELIMKYAKMASKIYHNNNELEKALHVMSVAYKKCPSLFNLDDTNLYLELLIAAKEYEKCIEVFVFNVGIEVEAEIQTISENNAIVEHTNYVNCSIPDNLPIDLRTKLLVCFIHLGAYNLFIKMLNDFLTNDVDKAGDLYMDVEEALSSVGRHELALKLLQPLIQNKNFDLGAVWLKHAECLDKLGMEKPAIQSYRTVLKHAPQHYDARLRLFTILEKHGDIDDALDTLQQDYKLAVSAKLLHLYLGQLKKYNKIQKYLEVGEALLSKTFMTFRHKEELKIIRRMKGNIESIYAFRESRKEKPYNEDDIQFDEEEDFKLSKQEEWDLFNELIEIAFDRKHYNVMQRLAFGAHKSKSLQSYSSIINFYCLQASLFNKDYDMAYPIIRDISLKTRTVKCFNLMNLMTSFVDKAFGLKYLVRFFQKNYDPVKSLFLGNAVLMAGRYSVALKHYLEYNQMFNDPLSTLLIGISLLGTSSQRTVDGHHMLILQGISYLKKYKKLRRCDQEAYYNIGRAYQMLSLNNLAMEYYERALASPPAVNCETHGNMDLSREIAYNICLLCKEHSPHIAQKYMMQYIVI